MCNAQSLDILVTRVDFCAYNEKDRLKKNLIFVLVHNIHCVVLPSEAMLLLSPNTWTDGLKVVGILMPYYCYCLHDILRCTIIIMFCSVVEGDAGGFLRRYRISS